MDADITNIAMSKLEELLKKAKELEEQKLQTSLSDFSNLSSKDQAQVFTAFKRNLNRLQKQLSDKKGSEEIAKKYGDVAEKYARLYGDLKNLNIKDFDNNPYRQLSDDELIRLAEEFSVLDDDKKASMFIGSGIHKKAYEIPELGLVLKSGINDRFFRTDPTASIIKDYLGNKFTEDLMPAGLKDPKSNTDWIKDILERPKMIALPGKEPLLIQRKLVSPDILPRNIEDNIGAMGMHLENDLDKLKYEFRPTDLHAGNVGIEPDSKKMKVFDAFPSMEAVDKMDQNYKDFRNDIDNLKIPKVFRAILPALKTAGKLVPLAGAYGSYAEAREEGLPEAAAVAYAASEEVNPLPISGIDYFKGMEKAAEGRREAIEQNYAPEKNRVELDALENYKNSPAAKQAAYSRIRKLLKD